MHLIIYFTNLKKLIIIWDKNISCILVTTYLQLLKGANKIIQATPTSLGDYFFENIFLNILTKVLKRILKKFEFFFYTIMSRFM
jgi:hypothetical protein